MRVLLRIQVPVEAGNAAIEDGSLPNAIKALGESTIPRRPSALDEGGIASGYGNRAKRASLVIGFIVAGLVIGALARLIKPGDQDLGIFMTLLVGVVGSVIGGVIASLLGTGDIFELNILGFIVAVVASILLLGIAEAMSGKGASR